VTVEPAPILIVELPVPDGRETEWNAWYEGEHIPDFLATVQGARRSTRYRVLGQPDDGIRYLVVHEFATLDALRAFADSALLHGRLDEYTRRWGQPAVYRRRAFEPVFTARPSAEDD
jgi:hypothetical protein